MTDRIIRRLWPDRPQRCSPTRASDDARSRARARPIDPFCHSAGIRRRRCRALPWPRYPAIPPTPRDPHRRARRASSVPVRRENCGQSRSTAATASLSRRSAGYAGAAEAMRILVNRSLGVRVPSSAQIVSSPYQLSGVVFSAVRWLWLPPPAAVSGLREWTACTSPTHPPRAQLSR